MKRKTIFILTFLISVFAISIQAFARTGYHQQIQTLCYDQETVEVVTVAMDCGWGEGYCEDLTCGQGTAEIRPF